MADDNAPKGLPAAKNRKRETAADKMTHCPKCNNELRVVSNYLGVMAHCDPCKDFFPISSTPRRVEPVMNLPRGLHKRTMVEPDWGKAFEDTGESGNDPNQ